MSQQPRCGSECALRVLANCVVENGNVKQRTAGVARGEQMLELPTHGCEGGR